MTARKPEPSPPPPVLPGCPACHADPVPPSLYFPWCSRQHWLTRPGSKTTTLKAYPGGDQ